MMKHIPFLISLWAVCLLSGCDKDGDTYNYSPISDIKIDSISAKYTCVMGVDTLKITPEITTGYAESELEYSWVLLRSGGDRDTLSHEQALSFPIVEPPGTYTLYYYVKNSANGYAAFSKISLEVVTMYSRGHFILKETVAGNTDLDLLLEDRQLITDVLEKTQGAALSGKPRQLGILYNKWIIDPNTLNRVRAQSLGIITYDKEVAIFRAFDMYKAFDHSSMFFEEPGGTPYLFYTGYYNNAYLSGDGIYHLSMNTTASGKLGYPVDEDLSGGSDYWAWCLNPLGLVYWDESNRRLIYTNHNNVPTAVTSTTFAIPDADDDCLFIGTYGTQIVYALCRDNGTNTYNLYTFTATRSLSPPVLTDVKTISSSSKIVSASLRASNEKTANVIYFVHNNQPYYYDVVNDAEHALTIPGLPADETITYISNRYYYFWSAFDFDYFVVATEKNGQYKLFMYNMVGGLPNGEPVLMATGIGKVKEVDFLGPAFDSTYFLLGCNYSR